MSSQVTKKLFVISFYVADVIVHDVITHKETCFCMYYFLRNIIGISPSQLLKGYDTLHSLCIELKVMATWWSGWQITSIRKIYRPSYFSLCSVRISRCTAPTAKRKSTKRSIWFVWFAYGPGDKYGPAEEGRRCCDYRRSLLIRCKFVVSRNGNTSFNFNGPLQFSIRAWHCCSAASQCFAIVVAATEVVEIVLYYRGLLCFINICSGTVRRRAKAHFGGLLGLWNRMAQT